MKIAWLAAVTFAGGCGQAPAHAGDDGPPDASGDGSGSATIDGSTDGFVPLISRTWSLGADSEKYECRRIVVPEDMWVNAFRVVAPPNTHLSVLTISTDSTTLGDYDCAASTVDHEILYAAGVDTDDLKLPDGIAVHLTAGQYINLNVHLFNAGTTAITDAESSVLVKTIPAAAVIHEADMTFAGTVNISIPDDNLPHTASGGCNAPADWHVFALWPHMHQIAIHQKFSVTHAGAAATLLDTDYSFQDQLNHPMADTMIHAGDLLSVTCTYQNDTGHVMTFGDSSLDEMCFTNLYKYPAGDSSFQCAPQ